MSFQPSFTEDEFWEAFQVFNSFFDPCQWQETTARKSHEDEFGDTVSEGESYFTKDCGPAWGDRFKLSRRSMEIVLMILLSNNSHAKGIGLMLLEAKQDRLREAVQKMSDKMGLKQP